MARNAPPVTLARNTSGGHAYWKASWTEPAPTGPGRRRSRSLGRCDAVPRRDAVAACRAIEADLAARRDRSQATPTLADAFDRYVDDRPTLAPSTRRKLDAAEAHAGPLGLAPCNRIAAADLWAVRARLEQALSPAGAASNLRHLRAVIHHAARLGWADPSITRGLVPTVRTDHDWPHVTLEEIAAVEAACPDDAWRLLFALCRRAGLRRSEALRLAPADVDLDAGVLTVRPGDDRAGPVGRRRDAHASPESPPPPPRRAVASHTRTTKARLRRLPIDPPRSPAGLRPILERAIERADEESRGVLAPGLEAARASGPRPEAVPFLAGRFRNNIPRDAAAIIRRAGLSPWSKPLHTLRKARQTELALVYPEWVVAEWLGNSVGVGRAHYLSAGVLGDEATKRRSDEGDPGPPRAGTVGPSRAPGRDAGALDALAEALANLSAADRARVLAHAMISDDAVKHGSRPGDRSIPGRH